MKLENVYREVIKKGIESDLRAKKKIDDLLKKNSQKYDKLDKKEKECFDLDSLFNPFADTRVLRGDLKEEIKSMIVGIDVEGGELLLVDRMKEKGTDIDLVVTHHPEGKAFANFYEVMDLQIDVFTKEGISVSTAENLLGERKAQVARRVGAANHARNVDIAGMLGLNFLCMHTPCDNLAYRFVREVIDKNQPDTLGGIIDLLYSIPEYLDAAKNNNPPQIIIGRKEAQCRHVCLEFTGGTEGPQDIYSQLSARGVDTIIAMHQSEEHFKQCKQYNINVIVASHIASDSLGINLMLDYLESKAKLKIYEFSGFRRFKR